METGSVITVLCAKADAAASAVTKRYRAFPGRNRGDTAPHHGSHTGSAVPPEQRSRNMTTPKTGFTFALIAVALVVMPATAQDIGGVQEMDGNQDTVVTKAEAQAALEARFQKMDTNHDGKLSEDEFVNSGLAKLATFDTNHDGNVTRDELRSAFRDRLSRFRR